MPWEEEGRLGPRTCKSCSRIPHGWRAAGDRYIVEGEGEGEGMEVMEGRKCGVVDAMRPHAMFPI